MISVCIATYNGERYLKDQLNSILIQLDTNDEIIISDDSSTDQTLSIVNSFNDKRIKVIPHHKDERYFKFKCANHYLTTNNYENAISHSKGDYIFLADQDDIWIKDKIEIMLSYLLRYDLVMSDCFLINTKGEIFKTSFFEITKAGKGILKNIINPSYHGSCMAFRRELLNSALPFPKNLIMHDAWLGLVSELTGNVIFINDKLIKYRKHELSVSGISFKSQNSFFFKVYYRTALFYQIILRFCRLKLGISF